ncbi:putative tape measure protein [Proteus phage P16-2532]|nr:putative tape measure protein [Proteus phage P16-2532]
MANRDVELRIRARDDSQKTLKQVSKTLDDLTSAQTRNADAAKRGDASVRELEQQYKKLENAGQQLLRLNSLTEMFTRQKEALNKVNTQLAEAKKNIVTCPPL